MTKSPDKHRSMIVWLSYLGCIVSLLAQSSVALLIPEDPGVSVQLGDNSVSLSWRDRSVTLEESTPIYPRYEIESSKDLAVWSTTGEVVDLRVNGSSQNYTLAFDRASQAIYYRLKMTVDLSGRDLSGVELVSEDLSDQDLSSTDLQRANLSGAILTNSCDGFGRPNPSDW